MAWVEWIPQLQPSPAEILASFFGREKADLVKKCPKTRAKQPLKVGAFYTKKGNFIILRAYILRCKVFSFMEGKNSWFLKPYLSSGYL